MSQWGWILLASAAAFATKFAGFLVPPHWLDGPRARAAAMSLTVGLLASLTAVNAFAEGRALVLDARAGALLAAAAALALRLPFLAVVVVGAAAAAVLRLL
ncbi:MAG: AzlD domain-containing protein [Gammaproteobacteria bacterium]|jgi:uncharacterized membrane protein|nr:AzlD domain-containing protein [Gammaproteobacteria bacterium]